MSVLIAVLPPQIRRRWDAIALQQLAARAHELERENEELASRARWAEDSCDMWQRIAEIHQEGGTVGLTVHGSVVALDSSPGVTIDDDPEYRA